LLDVVDRRLQDLAGLDNGDVGCRFLNPTSRIVAQWFEVQLNRNQFVDHGGQSMSIDRHPPVALELAWQVASPVAAVAGS
jgi:hypothetical protein